MNDAPLSARRGPEPGGNRMNFKALANAALAGSAMQRMSGVKVRRTQTGFPGAEHAPLSARSKSTEEGEAVRAGSKESLSSASVPQEAINATFCPIQEKFHTFIFRCLRNISEAP